MGRVCLMKNTIMVAMLACLLGACSVFFRQPEPGMNVSESIELCFRQNDQAHVLATARPSDCFSMRCTHQNYKSGTAVLDVRASRLDFEMTFNLSEEKNLLFGCGGDCAGGGSLQFDLGPLPVGLYAVYLWDAYLGDLSVTSGLPWHDQCLP